MLTKQERDIISFTSELKNLHRFEKLQKAYYETDKRDSIISKELLQFSPVYG